MKIRDEAKIHCVISDCVKTKKKCLLMLLRLINILLRDTFLRLLEI